MILFVYVLIHCTRTLRGLTNVQFDVARSTVDFARQFTGTRPFGPAGALKCYLGQVGWELQEDGTVMGPELLRFNIFQDSTKKIKNVILAMWVVIF